MVGAGPAGATTALSLLAARPQLKGRVAIIERRALPRVKICAGAVGGRAIERLERLGVSRDELLDGHDERPAEVFGLAVTTEHGPLFRRHPRPIGWVVRRRWFDHALLRAAERRGAVVHAPRRYRNHRVTPDAVTIDTDAGLMRAEALVGADGVGSAVRRRLDLPPGDTHAQAVELDTAWSARDLGTDLLHFDLRRGRFPGYAWDFPTLVDGQSRACRGVYALTKSALDRDDRDVGVRLDTHLEALGLPDGERRRFAERGLPLSQPISRPRVLLAGEAAGIDPVLGEGIAQAVHYGDLAGLALDEALDTSDFSFRTWRRRVHGSRLGLDLKLRTWLLPWLYGGTRPWVERLVSRSHALARSGQHYFAGERIPRPLLAVALADTLSTW